jgi:uncharacterized protein
LRIAATADIHYSGQRATLLKQNLPKVRDEADVLVIAGDLTNFGKPEELEPFLAALVRLGVPTIIVLGNHDYESAQQSTLGLMVTNAGLHLLDGTGMEWNGVGFAGAKGFIGGFGRGALTAFGEPEVKAFVKASIDETLKLETALSQLRTPKRVVVLHYAPIQGTVIGELPEIYCYLGTSRLMEVIDRHGADLVLHGHAHHGTLEATSNTGIPVRNVALPLLQAQDPNQIYRVFEI